MSKPVSSVDRPLTLRLRPDLVAVPIAMSGTTAWLVKDPVTLEHFQFTPEEHAIVDRLRRQASIGDLQRELAQKFPPQTISPQAVWEFLSRLHNAGLLVSDAIGQGHELLLRTRHERTRRWALAWTQILAIRFRGFDPDAFLTAVHKKCRWLFSPAMLLAAAMLVLLAASIVIGHFSEFRSRLPELSALMDPHNLLWLMIAIGSVKVLHELGHAMACKHFGGEVHELGFMLLTFTPCLYCDVTDAWQFPSKRQRILVSAAGMLVEIVLAAIATIVWWYAQPGVLNLVALNIMVVCTVSTVLINGNPLLRYDGYYILSDLIETPNLWQRSREVLRKFTSDWLRRVPTPDDPLVPATHRFWLAAYAVASKINLAVLCVGIVWGLVVLLYPYHLQNLAYAVGLTIFGSALVGPVMGAVQFWRNPSRRGEYRRGRFALATAIGLAVLVGILALPVNYYVPAPLVLLPSDAARVYATTDGTLSDALPAERRVSRGEKIGKLENSEVELELARLEGQHKLQKMRVEHLERLRGLDPEANDKLPAARSALADVERQLEDRRRDAERLTLIAPVDGTVIPVPRTESKADPGGSLPTWSGAILDPLNRDAHVEAGTLVCLVGDPLRLSAVLLVDDTDVKRLQRGQKVRMRFDQLPGQVIEGKVVEIARHDVDESESAGTSRADLAPLLVGLVPPGRTASRYQVEVQFDPPPQPLVVGGRGEAKVAAERITLARRIFRYFAQTFRLPV